MTDSQDEQTQIDTKNMTEQQYLELADQFKEQMEEKNYEIKSLKREIEEVSKNFISLYGMLRVMDYLISNGEVEMELAVLIEVARGFASTVLEDM